MDDAEAAEFIRQNTALLAPPLTPEILLHLATESLPIWRRTEEELGALNVPPPYWAFAWAGGQALARYVLDNPVEVAGKSVIDIGAGSGLLAIAAARAGAAHVGAIDIDALAIVAIRLNAAANAVSVVASRYDPIAGPPPAADVLLVGDLFYERDLARGVLALLDAAVARGARVFIGDPCRTYFPRDRFVQVAEYRVAVTRELEDAEIKRTAVWRYPAA